MGNCFRISGNAAYGKRILPLILALVACLMWVSAAHAQEAPFNSQYDPPPTTPPECGPDGGDGSGGGAGSSGGSDSAGVAGDFDPGVSGGAGDPNCDPQVLSSTENPIEVLPTTGGLLAAPVLLGVAIIAAAGIIMVRRKR